jgi:hypothetical protein
MAKCEQAVACPARAIGRPATKVEWISSANIPLPYGGDVLELQAWVDGHFVRERGERPLLVLAWHSFYDGGEYSLFRIGTEGITELISGAGGAC